MRREFTQPHGRDSRMFDWRYWRWQITRNLPIAVVVALLVSASGWAILNATPPKYTASSRIVLERQIGIASTYKTGPPHSTNPTQRAQPDLAQPSNVLLASGVRQPTQPSVVIRAAGRSDKRILVAINAFGSDKYMILIAYFKTFFGEKMTNAMIG